MTDLYVHVVAGVVDLGPAPLPRNWRHVSGLDGLSDEELAPLGWYPAPGEAPAHDPRWQTCAGPVAVSDGEGWRAEWTVTDRLVDELRAERSADVNRTRDEMIARGAPITIGESSLTAQTRDERDFRNITGLVTAAILAQAAGSSATMPFRDADDAVWDLAPAEVILLGTQAMAWVQAHYQAAWAHKDALLALETAEAVATYDITIGWPE